jgi:hypothetical protein
VQNNTKNQKINLFFKKTGNELKEMSKPLLPDKQRSAAKIKQTSPMKVRDSEDQATELHLKALELSQKEDAIDLVALSQQNDTRRDLQSDPASQRQLRGNRKRDYKKMLEGDEVYQKTIEDE